MALPICRCCCGRPSQPSWWSCTLPTATTNKRRGSSLVFEAEFEEEKGGGQHEREHVGGNHGDVAHQDAIGQPQRYAQAKKGKHTQREVLCRTAFPGFDHL